METTFFSYKNNILELKVIIQPRASSDEIAWLARAMPKNATLSPPVAGEANKYLIQYLYKAFSYQKNISISKGLTNCLKTVPIQAVKKIPSQFEALKRS